MAKSKRCRGTVTTSYCAHHHNCGNPTCAAHGNGSKPFNSANDVIDQTEITQSAIDRHWSALPEGARSYILGTQDGMFSLQQLVLFWSQPANADYTRGSIAGSICGALWYLALVYLRRNCFREARALTIHGAFVHQCYNSSLEYIHELFDAAQNYGEPINEHNMSYFARGCNTLRSPSSMKKYIEAYLPKEYTQMMTSFANLSDKKNVMGYVGQIGDDWKGTSANSSSKHHSRSSCQKEDETQIQLIFVDDADENDRRTLDIGSETELKSLFNNYADKRGASLRALRFSFAGKMLFLSSAGHVTPHEMNMKNGDIVEVHDTSRVPESSNGESSSDGVGGKAKGFRKSRAKKTKGKKTKKNKKSQQQQQQDAYPTKSLEEHKVEHSKQLTKLHEEAEHQFKDIRRRLNNLVIERSQPKKKSKRPCTPKKGSSLPSNVKTPSMEGLGGKAGKPYYEIQVGEVQNLYKTTKPSSINAQRSPMSLSTLDLHGCTREEALSRLDDALDAWVDSAMRGPYPFVRPATIVCGCGNQVLSETVQEWIRRNDKVSNAPKLKGGRWRVISSRAA